MRNIGTGHLLKKAKIKERQPQKVSFATSQNNNCLFIISIILFIVFSVAQYGFYTYNNTWGLYKKSAKSSTKEPAKS
jgi:hypothetical protein